MNRIGHFGERVDVSQIEFNVGLRGVGGRQFNLCGLLGGDGGRERGTLTPNEIKRLRDRFAVFVVFGFRDAVLVDNHRDIVEGKDGFHHGTCVFFLFVVLSKRLMISSLVADGSAVGWSLADLLRA